jgi:hypothetical protein
MIRRSSRSLATACAIALWVSLSTTTFAQGDPSEIAGAPNECIAMCVKEHFACIDDGKDPTQCGIDLRLCPLRCER